MGWDKGRYYTRSKKVNGRVVREYVGAGRTGELAARLDDLQREQRRLEYAEVRAHRAELDALAATIKGITEMTDLVAKAALMAAGFYRHKRGEWRKRREQHTTRRDKANHE